MQTILGLKKIKEIKSAASKIKLVSVKIASYLLKKPEKRQNEMFC